MALIEEFLSPCELYVRMDGGRNISCNMAFCDPREIAKGRKMKKDSVFLSLPFHATMLEKLRKCPAIKNNEKKGHIIFPGEPG